MSLELEPLRQVFREELEARLRLDAQTHADHHAFIAELVDAAKRRREMWDRVRQQVIGWVVIGSLAAFAGMVARELVRLVNRSNGGG